MVTAHPDRPSWGTSEILQNGHLGKRRKSEGGGLGVVGFTRMVPRMRKIHSPENSTLDLVVRFFFRPKKILEMKKGDILEVLADDPVAEEDIKFWIKKTGHDLIFFNKTEKLLKFFICKIK